MVDTATLLNSSIELNNRAVDIIKSIKEVSAKNKDCVCNEISKLNDLVKGNQNLTIDQIKLLESELEAVNETIEKEQGNVITKISEMLKDFPGIFSNMQAALDNANGMIGDIQNTDNGMYGLLEDANNSLQSVGPAIEEGTQKIAEAVSLSLDKQNSIVAEEQSILESYNELLSRINDEVIAKMINDSNTLLKCLKDCYNLLDSQRRAKK